MERPLILWPRNRTIDLDRHTATPHPAPPPHLCTKHISVNERACSVCLPKKSAWVGVSWKATSQLVM